MPTDTRTGKQQPEALATFAAAARAGGKKPGSIGLHATPETAPVATSHEDEVDAATRVIREGVLKRNQGADAAIDKLPDRVTKGA